MAIKLGNLILKSPVPVKELSDASPPAETPVPDETPTKSESPPDSTQPEAAPARSTSVRLGALRVGGARPADSAAVAVVEPAVVEHESGTQEGFQAKLDKLDRLVVAGISTLTLDSARHYVKDIFIELRTFPEFDPLFKDRDMHNMMTFMQQTTIQAKELITEKKTKAETKATKKVNTQFGDFGSFGDPTAQSLRTNQILQADAVGGALAAFGATKTDDIESKERRGRG